jgi:hypothetical protein
MSLSHRYSPKPCFIYLLKALSSKKTPHRSQTVPEVMYMLMLGCKVRHFCCVYIAVLYSSFSVPIFCCFILIGEILLIVYDVKLTYQATVALGLSDVLNI